MWRSLPLEVLSDPCDGEPGTPLTAPFPAVTPGSFQFPGGDSAQVEYYDDGASANSEFGFLKITIEARTLTCQFIGATSNQALNQFALDLDSHKYR